MNRSRSVARRYIGVNKNKQLYNKSVFRQRFEPSISRIHTRSAVHNYYMDQRGYLLRFTKQTQLSYALSCSVASSLLLTSASTIG
jgi:hypothetical protein